VRRQAVAESDMWFTCTMWHVAVIIIISSSNSRWTLLCQSIYHQVTDCMMLQALVHCARQPCDSCSFDSTDGVQWISLTKRNCCGYGRLSVQCLPLLVSLHHTMLSTDVLPGCRPTDWWDNKMDRFKKCIAPVLHDEVQRRSRYQDVQNFISVVFWFFYS